MKRMITLAIILLLALAVALPALADGTVYVKTPNGRTVNLRSPKDASVVIAQVPYGTQLTFDDDKSTEISAYVTYKGQAGYIRWNYLSQTKPAAYRKSASASKSSEIAEAYGTGEFTVTAAGAYIQFPGKKGRASGDRYSSVLFDDPVDIVVTASIPRGKKLAGWKINGVYMTFYSSVKSFRLPEVTESLDIEAVFK